MSWLASRANLQPIHPFQKIITISRIEGGACGQERNSIGMKEGAEVIVKECR
jgi:hypothetical protein